MADDAVRAPVLGRVLWRGRRLLIALAVLGAGIGVLAWFVLPQSFTATTKVLLQGATSEDDVFTAAQVAMGRVVVDRAVTSLGWELRTVGEDAVKAEATQGNVITITTTAADPGRARALATQVSKEYIAFSTEVAGRAAQAAAEALDGRREDLQGQIDELDDAIGSQSELSALTGTQQPVNTDQEFLLTRRSELLQALHEVEQQIATARADAAVGAASIQVIEPAVVPEASSTPTLPMFAAGGAALTAAVGATALTASRLGDRRLRRRADIASALGAPVLGTVAAYFDADTPARRWSPVRWLLGTDSRTGVPESPQERRLELIRYSRVLERLHGVSDGPLQLAVVAPDDDGAAVRAVARLAAAADASGRPVALVGDTREFSMALGSENSAGTGLPSALAVAEGTGEDHPRGALRVISVPPARPTVPRDSEAAGALIVTTSGMRTNWELLAIADACRDGMMPVLGALVVVPIGAEEEVEAGSPIPASEPASPMAGRMNGHANGTKP